MGSQKTEQIVDEIVGIMEDFYNVSTNIMESVCLMELYDNLIVPHHYTILSTVVLYYPEFFEKEEIDREESVSELYSECMCRSCVHNRYERYGHNGRRMETFNALMMKKHFEDCDIESLGRHKHFVSFALAVLMEYCRVLNDEHYDFDESVFEKYTDIFPLDTIRVIFEEL